MSNLNMYKYAKNGLENPLKLKNFRCLSRQQFFFLVKTQLFKDDLGLTVLALVEPYLDGCVKII